MIERPPRPGAEPDEHLFGVRGPAVPAADPAAPAPRDRKLDDLAMSEAEWARLYAESSG